VNEPSAPNRTDLTLAVQKFFRQFHQADNHYRRDQTFFSRLTAGVFRRISSRACGLCRTAPAALPDHNPTSKARPSPPQLLRRVRPRGVGSSVGDTLITPGKVKFFNDTKGYTFNSADNGAAVLVYYSYTIASGNKISLANQLTGPLPMFEISLKETFNYFGTSKDLLVKLNACVSPKLSLPFSNQKFTVAEFDFQAIADASNNIGTISLSE